MIANVRSHQQANRNRRRKFVPSNSIKANLNIELDDYLIAGVEEVLTPALAIYPDIVDANIAATIRLLGNDSNRWRPHIKTAKLAFVMKRFVSQGIKKFKCSTTLELATVCETGATDV